MKRGSLFLIFIILTNFLFSQNVRIIPPVGHTSLITDVDVSPNGRYILSSSVDKTLIIWDYTTGNEIVKLAGTDYGVTSCAFGTNSENVYSAGWDGYIRKWSLESFEEELKWQAFSTGVNDIALFQKGKKIAAIGKDGVLKVWNTKNGDLLKELKVSDFACNAIVISEKDKYIAIGDIMGSLIIISSNNYNIIYNKKIHTSSITSMDFSYDKDVIATASYDYKIKLTNFETNEELYSFSDEYQMWSDIDVSSDGNKLSAVTLNGYLYELDLRKKELIFKEKSDLTMSSAVKYEPNGDKIISCGSTTFITVYKSIEGIKIKTFQAFTSPIENVDIAEHKFLIASAHWDSRLRIFNMHKCKLQNTAFMESHILSDLIFSKNQIELLISAMKPNVSIYDYTKDKLDVFIETEHGINAIALSESEEFFACVSDSTLTLFSSSKQQETIAFKHNAQAMDVCFSNDNNYLLSVGRDSTLLIVDAKTGELIKRISDLGSKAESVAIAEDNIHAAVGLWTGEIVIINIQTYEIEQRIKAHSWIVSDIEFSPVNDYLLSVSWDKKVSLWDWENDLFIAEYNGHTGSVMTCKYNNDGYYIVTGGWDNQLKILDSRNLEEICSVIPVDDEDYLIITPDLYYMGTAGAAKKVSFAVGMQTYNFEQFDLQYNRPDKVLELLPFADKSLVPIYKRAYDKRLEKTGFAPEYFENLYNAPQIFIKNRSNIELFTSKQELKLEMQAIDSIKYIDRYNIYVNGVGVFGSNGTNLRKSNKNDVSIKTKIILSEGLNEIEVSCTNSAGVESLRKKIDIFYSPETAAKKNLYIISLAVAEYDNSKYNLRYTINDGREIVNTFANLSPEYNLHVDTLFGKNCTRDNFVELKEKLINTEVDDIVIIHFSGHGLLSAEGNFYFATYDVDFNNPENNGLEYELIEGIIDGIPARNKLVLIDACHSGELDKMPVKSETKQKENVSDAAVSALASKGVIMYDSPNIEDNLSLENSFDLMSNYFADVRKGTGAVIISAATGTGFALEVNKLEHGVFTYVLVNGLKEKYADASGDGVITVSELRNYIFENVEKLSEGYQKPTARKDNLVNDFVIYK